MGSVGVGCTIVSAAFSCSGTITSTAGLGVIGVDSTIGACDSGTAIAGSNTACSVCGTGCGATSWVATGVGNCASVCSCGAGVAFVSGVCVCEGCDAGEASVLGSLGVDAAAAAPGRRRTALGAKLLPPSNHLSVCRLGERVEGATYY